MYILIATLILVFIPLAMLIIRLIRPGFVYHWLIALGGALVSWPLALLAGNRLPQTIPLVSWQPEALFRSSPVLLLDRLSWPYAVALATLALAVILTDVARAPDVDWSGWASSLILAALGLLAVLAGNPLTLLMAWMAIDLAELLIHLVHVEQSQARERVVVAFSARLAGSVLFIAAALTSVSTGAMLSFDVITPRANLVLMLAAGLRLGILPLQPPFAREVPLGRSLGTMSRLASAAAALVLLARTATAENEILFAPLLLGLAGLAGIFSGLSWAMARDELDGSSAWILGMTSLALAAAVLRQPTASLAWGIAALFSGGLIFLTTIHDRRVLWLTWLGLFGLSALPFSPAWNGVRLFTGKFHPFMVAYLLALVLLMVGYLRHAIRPGARLTSVERWIWVVYPLGLALLLATHVLLGFLTNPGLEDVPLAGWWVGPAVVGLSALISLLLGRITRSLRFIPTAFESVLSLDWLYRLLWRGYLAAGYLVSFLSTVLEGEGGVLWAFLLMMMLLLMISPGGG